jgi:hypothetical protein
VEPTNESELPIGDVEKYEFSDPEGFDVGAGSSLIPPELEVEE